MLSFFQNRRTHIALLVVGSLFLCIGAFHNNIWFDESFSVGIASFGFQEIWEIDSYDVHPVLFYWALHLVYLIFGANILAYRLFSIAGATALAVLGFTHLRKDFGPLVGIVFSFFVFFTPYIAFMACQIRMYSWVAFTVMLCGVYAYRIARNTLSNNVVPLRWWIVLGLAGLSSAYLQYFGAISAFVINLLLIMALVYAVRKLDIKSNVVKQIASFFICAVIQIALYIPWILVLLGQVGVVSGENYWAEFVFPDTIRELVTYPLTTLQVVYSGWFCDHGLVIQVLLVLALGILFVSLGVLFVSLLKIIKEHETIKGTILSSGLFSLGAYLGLLCVGFVASVLIDSYIMYYRYAFVCIGPLLFFLACVLVYVITNGASRESLLEKHVQLVASNKDAKANMAQKTCCVFLGSLLCVAVLAQGLSVIDNYSEKNEAPYVYFTEKYAEASAFQAELKQGGADCSIFNESGCSPLVLSSDIGIQGVLSVRFPEIQQTYLDWQKGNWARAYEAYGDTFHCVKSFDGLLDTYSGMFLVVGQSSKAQIPRDVKDIMNFDGVELVDTKTFFRPYERTYFTVALFKTM